MPATLEKPDAAKRARVCRGHDPDVTCNHFLPERIALEREALGSAFVDDPSAVWNLNADSGARNPNILRLAERTGAIVERLHQSLKRGGRLAADEREGYESLVYYHLYQRYRSDFQAMTVSAEAPSSVAKCFHAFAGNLREYLEPARREPLSGRRWRSCSPGSANWNGPSSTSSPTSSAAPRPWRGCGPRVGVDLHLQLQSLPPGPFPADARNHHAHFRSFRDGQGVGGAGDRLLGLHPF